jgi:hypothetical protein
MGEFFESGVKTAEMHYYIIMSFVHGCLVKGDFWILGPDLVVCPWRCEITLTKCMVWYFQKHDRLVKVDS